MTDMLTIGDCKDGAISEVKVTKKGGYLTIPVRITHDIEFSSSTSYFWNNIQCNSS